MKRITAVLLAVLLLCLTGCVEKGQETQPALPETAATAPVESTLPDASATVPMDPELPEDVVTPEQMPSQPEADAEIPPQPQPTIVTE